MAAGKLAAFGIETLLQVSTKLAYVFVELIVTAVTGVAYSKCCPDFEFSGRIMLFVARRQRSAEGG